MAKGKGVANIQKSDRGSKLISKPGFTHSSQPKGKSVGAVTNEKCGYGRSSHMSELKKQS